MCQRGPAVLGEHKISAAQHLDSISILASIPHLLDQYGLKCVVSNPMATCPCQVCPALCPQPGSLIPSLALILMIFPAGSLITGLG